MLKLLAGCLLIVNLKETTGVFICCNGKIIPDNLICSGTYECYDGNDERNCVNASASLFNNSCKIFDSYFTEDQKCDGVANCVNCFDELDCPGTTGREYFRCDDDSQCLMIPRLCDGTPQCSDVSDEKQIGFGFKCNGKSVTTNIDSPNQHFVAIPYRCIVPQQFKFSSSINFNKPYSVCFNNEDDCYTFNEDGKPILNISKCWPCLDGTIIQREQVCDTVFDCADLSDECLCERQFTRTICDPLLRDNNCSRNEVPCVFGNKCIDVHQLCDGSEDCPDGTDEMRCKNTPDCPISTVECDRVFIGRINATKCDGSFECKYGRDECGAGCPNESPYCGLLTCDYDDGKPTAEICDSNCTEVFTSYIPTLSCNKEKNCKNGIDEAFCPQLKHCDKNDPSSPIYNDRCTADRCNLVADCDNIVDELNCSSLTHFYCDNNKKFLPTYKVFDGVFDCDDYTDECLVTTSSVSSQTELIGNRFIYVALWIIMILAVVGNLIVIIKTSVDLVNANRNTNASSSTGGLNFSIMLLNLAVSDLLMGFYLLFIASKAIAFSGTYCQQKRNWLLSNQCVFAGVLAVVSSQMSVFMLVVMSSYRLYIVWKPFEARYMRWKRLSCTIACSWVLSILLAVIPTFPSISNNLANAIIIDQPYIPQSVSKQQLINLAETVNKLPGERQTIPEVASLSVSSFCTIFNKSLVVPYYCEESSQSSFGSLGYYSTDGVCLPRYYGTSDELAFIYSFVIVLIDFAAFLYILTVYVIIYYTASHKNNRDNQKDSIAVSRTRSRRSDALSGTIMRIIITDFLCWIPICIMSFLSFGGVAIPGMAYPITAIFLIPINSAVNPWIYSSFLVRKIKKVMPRIRQRMKQSETSQATDRKSSYVVNTVERTEII